MKNDNPPDVEAQKSRLESPLLQPARPGEDVRIDKTRFGSAPGNIHATVDPFGRSWRTNEFLRTTVSSSREWLLDPSAWANATGAAMPLFLLSYSSCVSYAQLITAGSPVDANVVTAMHLVGCGLSCIILPLRSKCPLIIPSVDITVTMFYTTVVQDIVRGAVSVSGGLSRSQIAATATLALPVNTVLMSLAIFYIGKRQASAIVSYLPYPVVAGFLGSIGWAIFAGSFAVLPASGEKVEVPQGLPALWLEAPWQLLCAVYMALSSVLLRGLRVSPRVVAVAPMTISLAGFWLIVLVCGLGVDDLRTSGWLFPEASEQPFWQVWTAQQPELVHWPLLLPQPQTFGGLGIVLVLSLTLRIAGIEGSTGMVLNVDQELKWTGIANVASGCAGAAIGSHSPGLTTFNQEAGSLDTRAAVLTGALQVTLWLSGLPAMNLFPRFLLGGILMNLGLVMLIEWMWNARHKVGRLGLLVIYTQVVSSAAFGLLPSVLIGVACACATAQAQLMTLHVLKYHVSGRSISSYVKRTQNEKTRLTMQSDLIEAVGLEGHLAEGPMIKFANYIRKYVGRNDQVRFMIFDFRFCQGINASACALLSKLDKFLEDKNIHACYSNTEEQMGAMLKSFGVAPEKLFDHKAASGFQLALKECEDKVLKLDSSIASVPGFFHLPEPEEAGQPTRTLQELRPLHLAALSSFFECSEEQIEALMDAGKVVKHRAGHVLTHQFRRESMLHVGIPGHGEVTEIIDVGQSAGAAHQVSVDRFGVLCGAECVLYDEPARATWLTSWSDSAVLTLSKEVVQNLASTDPELHRRLLTLTARQLLRRGDALSQAVELNKGGGWRGAAFDRRAAEMCAALDMPETEANRLGTPTIPRRVPAQQAGRRGADATVVRRGFGNLAPRIQRKDSISGWASSWLEARANRSSKSPPRSPAGAGVSR